MSVRALCARALLATLASQALAAASLASSPSSDSLVIVGTREPEALDRLAADVVRLDEASIRHSAADSLADLLRREAGLQLSRNGGPGQSAGLFVRGASSGQTVLLVDGVRVGSATLGWPNFDAVPLAAIDRVEVLRGPGSSLYGADAVGGVVRVFTRRSAPGLQVSAQALAGGFGAREASLTVGGAAGAWDHLVTLSHEGNDGVSSLRAGDRFGNYNPDADGYRQRSAQATVGYSPARGHRVGVTLLDTRVDADYDASEYLAPSYRPDATPDFRNRGTSRVAALDWRGEWSSQVTTSAQASRSVDDLVSGANAPERYRTERGQLTAQLAWRPGAAQQWVLAAEALDEQVQSTAYLTQAERRSHAVVLAWSGAARGLSGQADLRHDHSAAHGGVTTGRVGASWALAPGLRLRALAGTTFRAPGFNDLYYPGYGVSTLSPERGRSLEAGLSWRQGANEASATVFRNRVRELIGYEPDAALCPDDPSYAYGCARNVDRATLQGITLAAARRFGSLALRAQLDGLDAHDERTGARLPRRAAHQAMLGVEQSLGAWRWSAQVLRVGARPEGDFTLPAETTLDLLASWRVAPRWVLLAKLLNATDRDLQPARDYRGLGRQAWLGLRFEGGR